MNMQVTQLALVSAGSLFLGCKEPTEKTVEEYETVSDIPQPSQELDEDEDTEDQDEDQGGDPDEGDGDGDGDGDGEDNDDPTDPDDEIETISYEFDSETSLIYVQVFKDTSALGSAFAHDHVMRADNFEGRVDYNTSDASLCDISFSLPVTDLRVDESGMRDLVGYDDSLSTSDRNQVREHMLDSNQLNENSFSTIDFESTGCSGDGGSEGSLRVEGEMTIRGRSAGIAIPVNFEISGDRFYAQASFDMNHGDFGFEPYSAFSGTVRNDDPLRFVLDVVGEAN